MPEKFREQEPLRENKSEKYEPQKMPENLDGKTEDVEPKRGKGSHWERKERELLASFDKRVEAAKDLWTTAEAVRLEDTPEAVEEKIRGCVSKVESRFSSETLDNLLVYKKLLEDRKAAIEAVDKFKKDLGVQSILDMEPDDQEKCEELFDNEQTIYAKIASLEEKNPGVEFLDKFEKAAEELIEKNKYVKGILAEGSPEESREVFIENFLLSVSKKTFSDIGAKENITHVEAEPFCVIFDIKGRSEADIGDMAGTYFHDSPFIATWRSGEQTRKDRNFILWHEKIHNYLGPIQITDVYGFRRLEERLNRFKRLTEESAPPVVIDSEKKSFKKLKHFDLVDEHHEEILAAIKFHTESRAYISESRLRAIFLGASIDRHDKFINACHGLETAGIRLAKVSKRLEKEAEGIYDEDVKKACLKLKKGLEDGLIGVAENIKDNMAVAADIGQEAVDRVQTLFLMLKPTQYRHIKRYLEYVYGEEKIKAIEDRFALIDTFDLYPDDIDEFLKRTRDGGISFSEGEKKDVIDRVKGFDFSNFAGLGINSLEEARTYLSSLQGLLEKMGDTGPLKDFTRYFLPQLFYALLEKDTELKDIPNVYEELSEEERKVFEGTLQSYICDGFLDEDLDRAGVNITSLDEVKNLPLWDAIKMIGMESEMSSLIEGEEKRRREMEARIKKDK